MDYWGRTGGFSLVVPYALIDTSSGPFRASTNGVSDVGFLWQMNIFGGPALTSEQFQSFVPQTFSSFHLLVTTPLGFYQPSSPINPSANRWMISPTVNFSYTPDQGWTWAETYVAGRIFTDNGNYLVNGAQTLTQRPLPRLEEHLSRNVTDALWLSADAFYNLAGETSLDGIDQDNMANTLRIGAGMGLRLWRGADMGLNYERVVAKPASEPYSQTARLIESSCAPRPRFEDVVVEASYGTDYPAIAVSLHPDNLHAAAPSLLRYYSGLNATTDGSVSWRRFEPGSSRLYAGGPVSWHCPHQFIDLTMPMGVSQASGLHGIRRTRCL